jgi:hypothetical protein
MTHQPAASDMLESGAPLWSHIKYETGHVHAKWMIYKQLFGTSRETYEMLMEAARNAFALIEQVLLDDVQLTLAKLVDGSKGVASLLAVRKVLCKEPSHSDWLKSEFDPRLRALTRACSEVTRRRNDWIAHHARATVEAQAISPRMNPARQEIEDALAALRDVMHVVHTRLGEAELAYQHVFLGDDGEALVDVVRSGLLLEQLTRQGLIAGRY